MILLLLACTSGSPSHGDDTSGPDTSGPDGGSSDGGSSDGGLGDRGGCGQVEGPPPEDSVLDDEYWAHGVYIAGTDRRFVDIQDAIWGAMEGDTVVVKAGTWAGPVDLLGKAITLCSEEGPHVTEIDGQEDGSVLRLRSYEPAETLVQGFTLTGGVGEGDEVFGTTPHGGGVFIEWGSPTLRDLRIIGNEATIAGGVYARNAAPDIARLVVVGNHANQGGGGFVCSACKGSFRHSVLAWNTATMGPAGEYFWGAADFAQNLIQVPDGSVGAFRWLDPREEVEWTGGPNLLWPQVPLLEGADESEWPDSETWVELDPELLMDEALHITSAGAAAESFGPWSDPEVSPYGEWWMD